jgi:uncharacterized protein YhaN
VRFDRIELVRWGALQDVALELSGGAHGLHVVYGDNEAGKTTLQRAISALLFGVPVKTPDNFRFDYRELRLAAVLRFADGTVVPYQRRKANKQDLLDPAGQPLQIPQLERLGREVGLERFLAEWSLDHARLREGGRQLIEGKGRVGESLLSAGLGGVPIARLLQQLEAEAGALFRPSGSNPTINALLKGIAGLRAELSQSCVNPREVEDQLRRLEELRGREREARRALSEAQQELTRLERFERARPALVRRRELHQALAALEDVPRVAQDFGARRIGAITSRDDAEAALRKAGEELEALGHQLSSVQVDEEILTFAVEVEALASKVAVHEADVQELQRLRGARADAERAIEAEAMAVGLQREALILLAQGPWRQHEADVRALSEALALAEPEVLRLQGEVTEAQEESKALQAALEQLGPVVDLGPLERAFAALTEDGAPEKALSTHRRARDLAEAEAAAGFAGLSRWTLGEDALRTCALPTLEELDEHLDAHASKAQVQKKAEEVKALAADVERHGRSLARFAASGEVPTEQALRQARTQRDAGWKLVRRTLEGDGPTPAAIERWTAGESLIEAYERAVTGADALADGLRSDTARMTQHAQLTEELAECSGKLATEAQSLEQLERTVAQAEQRWAALWVPLKVEPASPRVMRSWLNQALEVKRLLLWAAAAKKTCIELEARLEHQGSQLASALGRALDGLEQLPVVRREAEQRLKAAEEDRRRREELTQGMEKVSRRLKAKQAELKKAVARRDGLHAQRARLAQALGMSEEATAAVLTSLLSRVSEVFARLQQLASEEQRLGLLEPRMSVFEQGRQALEARFGADVPALGRRLAKARDAHQRRRELQLLQKEAQTRQGDEALKLERARAALRALAEEAGTDDPAQLAAVQEANERRRELLTGLHECESGLLQDAPGGELQALAEEVAALGVEDAAVRREQALAEQEQASTQQTALVGEIAVLAEAIGAVKGTDAGAEKASELQSALVELRARSAAYLRSKFAAAMLGEAVERYRREHQSPVLLRASELFCRLTLGSFERLHVSGEEEDAVLCGLRVLEDGRPEDVAIGQMSDGARDQLFLALRVAALEHELQTREPLPVVVDDVLINLSDNRARAALQVLAELAQKTQVLLFTHHRRIAELAEALGSPEVFVHPLPGQAPSQVGRAVGT